MITGVRVLFKIRKRNPVVVPSNSSQRVAWEILREPLWISHRSALIILRPGSSSIVIHFSGLLLCISFKYGQSASVSDYLFAPLKGRPGSKGKAADSREKKRNSISTVDL